MYDNILCDGIAVLVNLTSVDGYCLIPRQGADDAVIAVGYGKLYEGSHDVGVCRLDCIDDGVHLLCGYVFNFILQDGEGHLHVLNECVAVFVGEVVLTNLCSSHIVDRRAAVVWQIV